MRTIQKFLSPCSVACSAPEVWAAVSILLLLPRIDRGAQLLLVMCIAGGITGSWWLPRWSQEGAQGVTILRVTVGLLGGTLLLAMGIMRLHTPAHVPSSILQTHELSAVTGRVIDDLRPGAGEFRRLTLQPEVVHTRTGWRGSATGRVTVIWRGEDTVVAGDRRLIPVRGDRLTVSMNRPWPATHDSPVIWADSERLELHPAGGSAAVRRAARQWIRRRLSRLDAGARPLTMALLLGERQEVPEEVLDSFRRAGAAHVLALSGMHLGVLAAILTAGTGLVVSRRMSRLVILPPMGIYVWIAGWIPSLVRALILVTLAACTRARERAVPLPLLLARTVLISTVLAPHLVVQVGFRLSILALIGIFLLAPGLTDILSPGLPRVLATYCAVTLGAMIATAPLSLSLFGEIYPGGLLLSGVLSFFVVVLMWIGLLVLVAATVPFLGTGLVHIASFLTHVVVQLAALGSRIPSLSASGAVAVVVVFIAIAGVRWVVQHRTVKTHADQPRFDY